MGAHRSRRYNADDVTVTATLRGVKVTFPCGQARYFYAGDAEEVARKLSEAALAVCEGRYADDRPTVACEHCGSRQPLTHFTCTQCGGPITIPPIAQFLIPT